MWEVHVFLDVVVSGGGFGLLLEPFEELLPIHEHHEFKEFSFMDFNRDFFKRVVSGEVSFLQVSPLEIVLESELVFESECFVGVFAFEAGLVVEDKEKAGVDVVLNGSNCTS